MARTTIEHAGSMRIRQDSSVARRVFETVARWLERRRTERELLRLDDRMLADIGLSRADIAIAAAAAVAAPATTPSLWTRPIEWARLVRAQARTARELERLPDYILTDIGIGRWQIREVAQAVTVKSAPRGETRGSSRAVSSPVHDLVHRAEAAVQPLRQWRISRVVAGRMTRLNRETLADLGYVKGDVDRVPEAMAERRLKRPANRNETRRGVA